MSFFIAGFDLVVLSFFQKNAEPETPTKTVLESDADAERIRIRCPLCLWQPNAGSRWYCGSVGNPEYFFSGCGTGWNTFDTQGLCPGCGHQWRWTACLSCWQWSLHEDWYTREPE
ncbi:MAG: hypothetical protein JST84_31040 [Acidobacteria bacterium]|nr:hypothetical protein [Acidobacteriota bacterium]